MWVRDEVQLQKFFAELFVEDPAIFYKVLSRVAQDSREDLIRDLSQVTGRRKGDFSRGLQNYFEKPTKHE